MVAQHGKVVLAKEQACVLGRLTYTHSELLLAA